MDCSHDIESLIDDLESIEAPYPELEIDALQRRSHMIIRNVFGEDSHYLQDFDEIFNYPRVAAISWTNPEPEHIWKAKQERQRKAEWESERGRIANLFKTMLEDCKRSGTNDFPTTTNDWAKQLLEWWDAGKIETSFFLVDITAGAGSDGIEVGGGLGFANDSSPPKLAVFWELEQQGLLQVQETRNVGGDRQWQILLLPALRESVGQNAQERSNQRDIFEEQSNSNYLIDISENSIFGSPQDATQYDCDVFVIMPFKDNFTPIFFDHLKPTVEQLGLSIKRGDDFFTKRSIMSDVWSAMFKADLIIADCTSRNPNVFYELGIAHILSAASGK